jgi:ABC-2 type transport system permease protein
MRNIYFIFKKEFKSYFNSPIAYIYITVFLVLSSWLFFHGFFIINQATMREFFQVLPWLFLFFIPAVTMRLWAEERRGGTIEILMTLPIRDYEVVMGKYLASLSLVILTLFLSFPFPLTVSILGEPDFGPIVCGYLGAALMGGAYLAIGVFISSLTRNQIVAFIIGVTFCFALLIIGEDFVLFTIPSKLVPLFRYLGLGTHYQSIGRGVIDSRDLLYYFSVIFFFLYLNLRSVQSMRWK